MTTEYELTIRDYLSIIKRHWVKMLMIFASIFLVSVLMAMNFTKGLVEQYKFLILLSTLTVLVAYLFSSAAYILILMESKTKGIRWKSSAVLASLAFIFALWIIAGAGQETVYWGFIMLMAGIPFYVIILWRRKVKS